MTLNNDIACAAANLCERVADSLDSLASVAVPLRRLGHAIRPAGNGSPTVRSRGKPLIQPNAEPTELDRVRAQRALRHSGIPLNQNGSNK